MEECNEVLKLAQGNSAQKGKTASAISWDDGKKGDPFPTTVTMGEKFSNSRREFPTKHMSDAECQALREKGLCFRCKEKYVVGHRCKIKS